MNKYLLALILTISLCGCTSPNPYSHYYEDYTQGKGVYGNPLFIPTTNAPIIRKGGDVLEDTDDMRRNGYNIIGVSSFNAGDTDTSLVIPHARNIGADVVLLYNEYTETVTGMVPISTPNMQSSYSQGSAFAYGTAGSANAIGSSHTTTYGTKTTYIPYNDRRYNYKATYWAKIKPLTFGAQLRDLNDDERRIIQSNKGVCVSLVVKYSPAFNNDILKGDIISEINGVAVVDEAHCGDILRDNTGKRISILILRDGHTLQKDVQLN